ncbi:hypothetical protein SAMN05660380_02101 [Xylella fastidiosa]|jgi:hypothetical protein|uniref:Uncharacterized protein n=1 Tax=Xylella fastidiosa (strain M23) TaxID=405441 RepID=B2IA71_XYLF2|nr:hypothetical protein XfasM23_2109 [Xylella fastidiosa M23]SHH08938.1 hypothetical protein SAMN05660380_02101 [Xylella fastidiosa]
MVSLFWTFLVHEALGRSRVVLVPGLEQPLNLERDYVSVSMREAARNRNRQEL